MIIKQTIGNIELWGREKTLFLTSRRAPLDKNLSLNALSKSFVRSENLLEHIVALFPQPEEKMAGTQTMSHPDTKRTTRN